MDKLIAYHGKPELKAKYLRRVRQHAAADEIIHGKYWEDGKGCAVGCTIHGNNHAAYERELGIPRVLARLEDTLFEGQKNGDAKAFPLRFLKAVRTGADLSRVHWHFLHWVLTEELASRDHPLVRESIQQCADVLAALKDGHVAARSAESAESAASAARSAESAARSAAGVAWSAERSAAESAAGVARSAESAARSAAGVARSAAESAAGVARSAESAARSAASAAESAARSAASAARSAASAAESAARSAESAARSAASAAWSAASAAWSAAESAAWSAESAAWSEAESAARSAESAASAARSAASAAYRRMAEKLLALIAAAPMAK